MACATIIRKDESLFNLAHRIVSVIVEHNNLNFDATWLQVSTNTIQQLQKRFRKLKRANNPLANVKKPRTSFSFYTKNCREKIAKANPNATFGELSKLVSKSWASLSDKERALYKKMETEDKERYRVEKEEVLSKLETETAETSTADSTTNTTEDTTTTTVPSVKAKKRKTTKGKLDTNTETKSTKTTKTTKTSTSKKPVKKVSYNAFQKEQRPLIKKANPSMALKDVNSQLGTMWKALSDDEKSKYTVTA